jgi:hypothetical protein
MNGIILNIVAYFVLCIVTLVLAIRLNAVEIQEKNMKFKGLFLGASLVLMAWAMFMFCYLVTDYTNIVNGPLNVRLNFYETITNFIFPVYLCTLAIALKVK